MADAIQSTTWRELEEKIKSIISTTPAKSFRTLTVTTPGGDTTNYSSWSDLRALLQEVVARRKEEEASSTSTDPAKQYGSICLTGHSGWGW